MDVILRNDPHVMDFNDYTNDELYIEGAIGDKIKEIINAIIAAIKKFISNIRGKISTAKFNYYKKMLDNPDKVEQLKKESCDRWDTDLNKKCFSEASDILTDAIKYIQMVLETRSTSGTDKFLSDIKSKNESLEKLIQSTNELPAGQSGKWTMYDAIKAIVEEMPLVEDFAYKTSTLNQVLEDSRKHKLDNLYGSEGVSREKIGNVLIETSKTVNIMCNMGIRTIGRFEHIHRSGFYTGNKKFDEKMANYEKALKNKRKENEAVKESYSIEELDSYIEYTMNDLHDAMELRNQLIQESNDDSSDDEDETLDDVEECGDSCNKPTTEYYSDAIIHNGNEPVQEETKYCLKSNDMFTTESYEDDTTPNRFVQEMVPDKYIAMSLDTAFTIRAAAKVFVICKAVESICDSLIYNKILGRFPSEMKRVMDLIKESKDGTINTKALRMALSDLKHEAKTVSGYNVISFKAKRNFTQTEREELRKLINITSDLEHMLTDKPDKAASRRISARIEDFVKQSEKVMKLINRGKNPGDVVKEYMS